VPVKPWKARKLMGVGPPGEKNPTVIVGGRFTVKREPSAWNTLTWPLEAAAVTISALPSLSKSAAATVVAPAKPG
jgi:hypothetical protein